MLKKIYSVNGQIEEDVKRIILNNKELSLKELLYTYAIPDTYAAPGSRIGWKGQKRKFKVIARNDNFIIITRPYNPKRTFEYSILDLEYMKCNHDNYYTKYDYSNKEECKEDLKELQETRDKVKRTNLANDCGLQVSTRGICNIEDVITEVWIEVKIVKGK